MTASAPAARPRARWILPEQPDPSLVRTLCDELLLELIPELLEFVLELLPELIPV